MARAAWKRDLSDPFKGRFDAEMIPVADALRDVGLGVRFFFGYYAKEKWWHGRIPTFDPFFHNISHPNQKGPPIGGIGCGVLTRSWQGDYTRSGIKAGLYNNALVPVNQFSLYSKRKNKMGAAVVLNCSKENDRTNLGEWSWWNTPGDAPKSHRQTINSTPTIYRDMKGTYECTYPRSWYTYEQPSNKLKLTCLQFSPVIAHNYKESSYPVGSFVWTIENLDDTEIEVSLMFTFQNGVDNEYGAGHTNIPFVDEKNQAAGVNMFHKLNYSSGEVRSGTVSDLLTFTIAAKNDGNSKISTVGSFDPSNPHHNAKLWNTFSQTGELDSLDEIQFPSVHNGLETRAGVGLAGAVCVKVTIPPNSTREINFAQSWDLPITRCGLSSYYKRYTRFYGKEERTLKNVIAQKIAIDALNNHKEWEKQIIQWQDPVLKNNDLPEWYKATLFNELYYVVDGGTVWTDGPRLGTNEQIPHDEEGYKSMHFSYLEGHEYVMFNTYDVHFYASSALIMNWPELQKSLQRDFTRAIDIEDPEVIRWAGRGVWEKRKVKNTVPHDVGTTCEDPWNRVNSYQIQNTNRWKDLNCEYVISCWRDYTVTKDEEFLQFVWPRVKAVMEYHEKNYDKDGDGLIENEGYPDSTYDNWVTNGPSAYCGGLWIAAAAIAEQIALEIARLDEKDKDAIVKSEYYAKLKEKATKSYEKLLWNDEKKYYNYEANKSNTYHDTVMSDQLCGHVHLLLTGIKPLQQNDRVHLALNKILELNVKRYKEITTFGGAVNGMRPNGEIDHHHVQTKEVWTGVTYLLAATLILEGRREEGFETAQGIYDTCWQKLGYWFQTPEAYDEKGAYRSCAYMRPLGIWSIHHALKIVDSQKK